MSACGDLSHWHVLCPLDVGFLPLPWLAHVKQRKSFPTLLKPTDLADANFKVHSGSRATAFSRYALLEWSHAFELGVLKTSQAGKGSQSPDYGRRHPEVTHVVERRARPHGDEETHHEVGEHQEEKCSLAPALDLDGQTRHQQDPDRIGGNRQAVVGPIVFSGLHMAIR